MARAGSRAARLSALTAKAHRTVWAYPWNIAGSNPSKNREGEEHGSLAWPILTVVPDVLLTGSCPLGLTILRVSTLTYIWNEQCVATVKFSPRPSPTWKRAKLEG